MLLRSWKLLLLLLAGTMPWPASVHLRLRRMLSEKLDMLGLQSLWTPLLPAAAAGAVREAGF